MFNSKELVDEQIVIVARIYLTYPTQKWIKVYHKKTELSKSDFAKIDTKGKVRDSPVVSVFCCPVWLETGS